MDWFKHDTAAINDPRIKKMVMKYGGDAYALYFVCLELIAHDFSKHKITFELEHDAEILADLVRPHTDSIMSAVQKIEVMMREMVGMGLFEEIDGRIYCTKMLKRMDLSMTSNPYMREIIKESKKFHENKKSHDNIMINHDAVMMNHDKSCQNRIDKNRLDKNREEEKLSDTLIDNVNNDNLFEFTANLFQTHYEPMYKKSFFISEKERKDIREIVTIFKDKETIEKYINALINKIKNTKEEKFKVMFTPQSLLNHKNNLIIKEPEKKPEVPRYSSGRPKIRGTMSLRHSILYYPDYAKEYTLVDVWEDDIQHGHRDAAGKWLLTDEDFERWQLSCYNENKE